MIILSGRILPKWCSDSPGWEILVLLYSLFLLDGITRKMSLTSKEYKFPILKRSLHWEFPGSPVVRLCTSSAGGMGSIPGQGTKIPQPVQCGQKK